jgi:glutamine synthetase
VSADRSDGVSETELVALVCCDLSAIVRGRSVPASELEAHLAAGVGWTPANHALTPLGPLAEPNPFGPTGDLRLLPDPDTHVRVEADAQTGEGSPLELVLCDIVETDGKPWECCPRRFCAMRWSGSSASSAPAYTRASSTSSSLWGPRRQP